jgi:hypothetical protein
MRARGEEGGLGAVVFIGLVVFKIFYPVRVFRGAFSVKFTGFLWLVGLRKVITPKDV